jgi:hypothetical protein
MLSIDSLVPGFDRALADVPGATETARILEESVGEPTLAPHIAALVRVAVAQKVGVPYARWAMNRIAERQWVGAEDIFLATVGTARDPVESAIVKASVRMAVIRGRSHAAEFGMLSRLLGEARATEVVAQVALAMLACEALAAIAPGTGAAARRKAA